MCEEVTIGRRYAHSWILGAGWSKEWLCDIKAQIFIEPRTKISQDFATDQDRRVKLWENCLFVFDTNVLTGIYRRSEEARDAQYKLMRALDDRLWIPHRVIYEFLDNRAKVVHDQAQLYAASVAELQGMLSGFEVVTKHPFLSAEVYREFNAVSQKVLAELEASREILRRPCH